MRAASQSDPLLTEENRAGTVELDDDRNDSQHWQQQDETECDYCRAVAK
jgi:hypothetical protein